jgi:hypothetical protein
MDPYDKYRANAVAAQRQADRATSPEDKASWLRLVEGWLSLLPNTKRTASENFDDEAKSKGSGQDVSRESQ